MFPISEKIHNKSVRRERTDPSLRAAMKSVLTNEYELYEFVLARFERQWRNLAKKKWGSRSGQMYRMKNG